MADERPLAKRRREQLGREKLSLVPDFDLDPRHVLALPGLTQNGRGAGDLNEPVLGEPRAGCDRMPHVGEQVPKDLDKVHLIVQDEVEVADLSVLVLPFGPGAVVLLVELVDLLPALLVQVFMSFQHVPEHVCLRVAVASGRLLRCPPPQRLLGAVDAASSASSRQTMYCNRIFRKGDPRSKSKRLV